MKKTYTETLEEAADILRQLEFVTVLPSKCPVCLGWDKVVGEQSRTHRTGCPLRDVLDRLDAFV